jgi:hypothetical protein
MLSSGSDASPEASPTRIYPSKGEKQDNLNSVCDRNDAAQNKGKTPTSTRKKNLASVKGRTKLPFS